MEESRPKDSHTRRSCVRPTKFHHGTPLGEGVKFWVGRKLSCLEKEQPKEERQGEPPMWGNKRGLRSSLTREGGKARGLGVGRVWGPNNPPKSQKKRKTRNPGKKEDQRAASERFFSKKQKKSDNPKCSQMPPEEDYCGAKGGVV